LKKILLIGSVGCGKTSLMQRLHHREQHYEKTQTLGWENDVYDTPGEYMELWYFRNALWVASNEVDLVCLLHAADVDFTRTPPAFHTLFTKPVIGIVTKIDLVGEPEIERAKSFLRLSGAERIFCVSNKTGEGFEALMEELDFPPPVVIPAPAGI
jgi:ethanolamine utilization protein EutP